MKKINVWDIIGWGSLLVLLLWALGKSFGLIHSPTWSEMIPVFTGFGAAATILIKLGEYKNAFATIQREFVTMRREFVTMQRDIHKMKIDVDGIPQIKRDIREIKTDLKEIHKSASCLKGKCAED